MTRKLVLAAVLSVIATGPASAACEGAAQWLWSASSDEVNRSTQALAAGRTPQAQSLAESVIARRLSPTDMRIAAYNLCLIHVASGAAADTDANCQTAQAGVERASLLCGESRGKARPVSGADVTAAITGNIAAAGGHGMIGQSTATR